MSKPLYPKFMIIDDKLVIAKVTYHKELVGNNQSLKGGGWFSFDSDTNTFTFFGKSEDFGKAKIEDLTKCIENNEVYNGRISNHRKLIVNDYSFKYRDEFSGEIINLK